MDSIVNLISDIEQAENINLILYICNDHSSKRIDGSDYFNLYNCLKSNEFDSKRETFLVIHTYGGNISATVRFIETLQEYFQRFNVFVPYKAMSSGTLICLASSRLLLGRLAELGPLDPQISSESIQTNVPSIISSADIKSYINMSREWFGVNPDQSIEILNQIVTHIFPTTLSYFYRAEKYILGKIVEYLQINNVDMTIDRAFEIANSLVNGYHTHNHAITRTEALKIGLDIEYPNDKLERTLTELVDLVQGFMRKAMTNESMGFIDSVIGTSSILVCNTH
ncbi:SDH family Clp fold serine proteinase [Deinococcus ruber]|uniref:Peptidase n=1 Tax=Deinococcus ruber TaxID=1848197 RepID=A0A918C7V0_9DEIO|nr:hypothetical protein [Deinococcus ruber]GGR10169.1 peptidase [Deinococcus ruber]